MAPTKKKDDDYDDDDEKNPGTGTMLSDWYSYFGLMYYCYGWLVVFSCVGKVIRALFSTFWFDSVDLAGWLILFLLQPNQIGSQIDAYTHT